MTITYEWDCETVTDDEFEDVEDHYHSAKLADVLAYSKASPPTDCTHRVVLVRDDDDRRSWAYLEDGVLPSHFDDADGRRWGKVPARFHAEVVKASKT